MALSVGDRIGPYEIVAPLGAGGMGEVYRARDTRLDREVAIKILPSELEGDEERRQRFEREARTVSRLNHPHICTLHDLGEQDGRHYLVMELLEGESLAERLQKGALRLYQVLRFGAQIAEALHAAHRQGITHRDLKPGNVVLTKSGAKLLDFGLAKGAGAGEGPIEGPSALPTEARPLTEKGSIVGTFQYMAPEQLEGLEADARTDIFALGSLLYEMATGRRAFQGSSRTSLIAAIVSSQPAPVSTVVPASPPALDHVIRKCLEKDPDDRWQSAHDVASELRWVGESGSGSGEGIALPRRRRGRSPVARLLAAGLVGVLAGAVGWSLLRGRAGVPGALPPLRFVIAHGGPGAGMGRALSTDGRRVAYVHEGSIWVRDLSELKPVKVPGTEGALVPFWSPDAQWLGFTSDERLWKVRLDGSGRTSLCTPAPGSDAGGAVWLPDGRIVFDTGSSGLYEVSDRGGTARVVLKPEEDEKDFHGVSALPEGRGFVFSVHNDEGMGTIGLWTGSERRTLLNLPGELVANVRYAPTGHLVFWRAPENPGIWAVPFSLRRLEVTGEPFWVARGLLPDVAANETLAYSPDALTEVSAQIVLVNRDGQVVRTIGEPRTGLDALSLSPDGRRVAVMVHSVSGGDLWTYDMEGGGTTRLSFLESQFAGIPTWTPTGDDVVQSWFSGGVWALRAHSADGSSGVRELGPGLSWPAFFSRDGKTLFYAHPNEQNLPELWKKELAGEGPGEPLLTGAGVWSDPALSPDGRFLAYVLEGKILVRSFPEMAGPWEVASGGATTPAWGPRDDRLYYLVGRDVMEVGVRTRPSFRVGSSRRLFEFGLAPGGARFAVTPDGQSFVMLQAKEPVPAIVVVQNWLGLTK